MKGNKPSIPSYKAIIGRDLYNFSLEPLKFPPNTPITKPEVYLNYRYIFEQPEPRLPLILSYQNVKRFFYKAQFTASSAQIYFYNADHVCLLDHEQMRCKICSISMKWCFLADSFQMRRSSIDYFRFDQVDPDFIFLPLIQNETTLRKYASFVVERPLGQGLEDVFLKNGRYPMEVFREMGLNERMRTFSNESFGIVADFESSNLAGFQIIQESNQSYALKLVMRGDTNALMNGFSQWFFFKLVAKKPVVLSMEIVNFRKRMTNNELDKSNTLCCFDFDSEGVNKLWRFLEENVRYSRNLPFQQASAEPKEQEKQSPQINALGFPSLEYEWYSLKFTLALETAKEVLLSFTYPYTYTNLIEFLFRQEKKLFAKGIKEQEFDYKTKEILLENELVSYNRVVLGSSLLGFPLILLQITSSKYQDPDLLFPAKNRQKKYIVIIARQHPGEPPGSFVVEGIIAFLMSDDPSAQILRTFFIFVIFPMMNPDGVVLGNNRTGLKGVDFNRVWRSPDKETVPEVALVKEYIENLRREGKKIAMFFDLHGHCHKKGAFVYSTPPSFLKDWEVNEDGILEWAKSSLYTNVLFNACKYLCFENCRSKFGKGKDESARMVMCKDLEIQHSYTVETSFSCYIDRSTSEIVRFQIEDYKTLGKDLMMAVLEYYTLIADVEHSKAGKSKEMKDGPEFNFNKFLSKVKKSYPNFKNSWKDYFSEVQLQKLCNKLGKFVDLMNENLFPQENEPSNKPFDPVVATEQGLKEFYESNLFDRGSNVLSPYEISDSSSFSGDNEDVNEGNNQKMEEIEREEHKKILGIMLFHEKDLKKTEKMLKKKAMKKTFIEKQNKDKVGSPGKRNPRGSTKNVFQLSQKSLLVEKQPSRRMVPERETEKSIVITKDNLIGMNDSSKGKNSEFREQNQYYFPIKDSELGIKEQSDSSFNEITPQKLKEKVGFIQTGKDTKFVKESEANDRRAPKMKMKSSMGISNSPMFQTTASTNLGTATLTTTASRQSISGKRRIPAFFGDEEDDKAGIIRENNAMDMENSMKSMPGFYSFKRVQRKKRNSKMQRTLDMAEINIPEEENEWSRRGEAKIRPKTAVALPRPTSFRRKNNGSRVVEGPRPSEKKRKSPELPQKGGPEKKTEITIEKEELSDYFLGLSWEKSSDYERLCNPQGRKRLISNPFVKSKREIYKLYSFRKPVIMVKDRAKTLTDGSGLGESMKREDVEPSEESERKKYRPFQIIRKRLV